MRVFLINLFSHTSKSITFCEASASFQGGHQMLRLPRLLTLCHVRAALPMRFMKKDPRVHFHGGVVHCQPWPFCKCTTLKPKEWPLELRKIP